MKRRGANYNQVEALDIASKLNSKLLLSYLQEPTFHKHYTSPYTSPDPQLFLPANNPSDPYIIRYRSNSGDIIEQSLSLDTGISNDGYYQFNLPEEIEYPKGAPVFQNEKIICLWSNNERCTPLDVDAVSRRVKRQSDNSCQVHHFDCVDPEFSSCDEGLGMGLCTNTLSNDRCTVTTYPYGSSLGDTIPCDNPDGCEQLFCPDGCTDDPESCTCTAIAGFRNSDIVFPNGCVEVINDSPVTSTMPSPPENGTENDCHNYIVALSVGFPALALASLIQTSLLIYCTVTTRQGWFRVL